MERDGIENHNNECHNNVNRTVGVHPSQYQRIVVRREERNRSVDRRGMERTENLPILPWDYLQCRNGIPYDQYGNRISPELFNHLMRNNCMVDGYVYNPRAANMCGVNMNARHIPLAYYRNIVHQNVLYNRYYGYRDPNGRPVAPNNNVNVRRIGPYGYEPNVNAQPCPTNPRVPNGYQDNVNQNDAPNQVQQVEELPQAVNSANSDEASTQIPELVNTKYYNVVTHTSEEVDMGLRMESSTTEVMESGSDSNSHGTMVQGITAVNTESTSTYVEPNGTEVIDPTMLPNGMENMDPHMMAYKADNAPGIMVPCEEVNSHGTMPGNVNPNMGQPMATPIQPNVPQNMVQPMQPNMVPIIVPMMVQAMVPNGAAGRVLPMLPGVPSKNAEIEYKMASIAFASIASSLDYEMGSNGQSKQMRKVTRVPTVRRNTKSKKKTKKETTDQQSAPNPSGQIDPRMLANPSGTVGPRMMANSSAQIDPRMVASMGPNGVEVMRAYLGPDSALNLAKYMVQKIVPYPYGTIGSVPPVQNNVGSYPCNPNVIPQQCAAQVSENVTVGSTNDVVPSTNEAVNNNEVVNNSEVVNNDNEVVINNTEVVNSNEVAINNEVEGKNEVVINNNDEVQPTDEEPRARRRGSRATSRNAVREIYRVIKGRRGNNRGTNRRTRNPNPNNRRAGNRNVRVNVNSNNASTIPCTEFDNRSQAEVEAPLTNFQGHRKELELMLNPQYATQLNEQVPSTRTIVDTNESGLVMDGYYYSNSATVKRQYEDITTRSTMSTMEENSGEYNYVAACAVPDEASTRKRQKTSHEQVENSQYSGQNVGVNCGGPDNMQQLVGTYPHQDYRASHEIYPAFNYVANAWELLIHSFLYSLYLIHNAYYGNNYGCSYCRNRDNLQPGNDPENMASSGNPSSENKTNTDDHGSTDNNSNTQNQSSVESNTNIDNNSSMDNINNTSNNTSIENKVNTSNNRSSEVGTQVKYKATKWCCPKAWYNEQDPNSVIEKYYKEHGWIYDHISYEAACAFVEWQYNLGGQNPRQEGLNNDQMLALTSTTDSQNTGANKTNANKSDDNQNDHQVRGGESIARTTESETAQLYRQLYECFKDDKSDEE